LDKSRHINAVQVTNRVSKVMGQVYKALQGLAKQVGISVLFTLYSARHTYARLLKESRAEMEVIRKAMGHASEITTRIYLESIRNEVIDEADERLP
jgi:integrase